MGARTLSDGASVTNHFALSFSPWVSEANVTSVSGLMDDSEVIDGPDGRGYPTGKKTKKELTVVLADHEEAYDQFMEWKEAVENGAVNAQATGTITRMNARDEPIRIWELERCFCRSGAANDMSIDGAEVGQTTFIVTYYSAKVIGP